MNLDGQLISDMERDDLHREVYRTQGKLTSCFGYNSMGRKAWQYATTLPAEKLSQIQNPLIKPERYVEHAYNPIHRRYEYDPAGELSRTLDKLRGETQYEYEANGQLLARNTGRVVDGEEFRYDAAANRLNFNTSRFDHVKDNRLKQWANHEYKYDAWGNLIEKVVGIVRWQTFTYDCENRLVKTETMAGTQVESTSSYQYDSLGRRVAKQSEIKGRTDHKRFLWQGLRMLREESPGQSSLYLYEPGSYAPLARVDEKEGEVENKVYYFHTDQIGTPLEMTDAEGQIVWQAKYRAWGAVEKLVVNEVEQNLRFQGQYFDVETGLHYNTFRYYDPEIGRFTTQDPIGFLGGFNLYQYSPSPIGWIDPWGWNCIPNKVAGMAREARAKELYGKRYGKENVLSERYLRNADGKIAKDPLTGEARRVDFVIKNSDGSGTAKEITSLTADKTGQLSKETRIREVGGTFVRDPKTKKLIEVRDVSTVVRAR
ncbi:RHS repeat-associated core domain-containing protein [Pseudomonas amygdali pv. morsprunorum]|uniref:RHS repeat-associated core domain-containing protein n=2 Tax=Pseudomonas TaxID=286 RepID=A0AB35QZM6_PSEA0|nr:MULTISPECIES: RHS repeat-associated core domain-containing protein [Pseudomonas syringae group]MDT3241417.1 RHS repeat-associated core domain-containing protein [Pseudomonas amygdali pv. morsprunorum]MDT3266912.1 RHS repeat-associated core domain-containing protein [Pseudomonas amygdali pv. morsprunorum]